jgi:hypothetical protein
MDLLAATEDSLAARTASVPISKFDLAPAAGI